MKNPKKPIKPTIEELQLYEEMKWMFPKMKKSVALAAIRKGLK